jgi:tetratricopeptide (TPR) repeat protein
MRPKNRLLVPLCGIPLIFLTAAASAAPAAPSSACDKWAAKIVSAQGTVEARAAQATAWRSAKLNETFCAGDMVRVLKNSRAAMLLANNTVLRLDQNTTVTLSGTEDKEVTLLDVLAGVVHFISRVPRALKVKTPYVNAAVEGTEFLVRVDPDRALLSVFEGRVRASNASGALALASGESAVARRGESPAARTVPRPRDEVFWALHYPSILDYRPVLLADASPDWAAAVRSAIEAQQSGDLARAFAAVATVAREPRDPRFFIYRAGLSLSVGRVESATRDIARALDLDPVNAEAAALQAVVALAQNDKERAHGLASTAAARRSDAAIVRIALSYTQQAQFDLEGAVASLEAALSRDPENALAWARLAELRLSVGDHDGALRAAARAAELKPNLALTQSVLGFAHLARMRTAEAKEAFERAIAQDSADPMPRLGLGLALIRTGALEDGRAELEIAASLDPNNALIRSYLGKAYYEEKRGKLAESQLAMAKELDPKDPTPWFYDAIRKQSENRPVEALKDLQKSIELNDNRAVYRSRLLLDQDLAARSASLGRIYQDLGFQQRALAEGWKSVSTDPSNYSAHRFLADSYSALPRHEIARASELLQAQMLQPLNLNPIQPQLAETSLAILEGAGPSRAAFNEHTPLFVRDRVGVQINALGGNRDTHGDDVVVTGLWDRFSVSLGHFHYGTDGFRANNDLDQETRSFFVQAAVTPRLNLQAEHRRRAVTRGDLDLNFDPANFSTTERWTIAQDSQRLGLRYTLSPAADLLASWIWVERVGRQHLPAAPAGAGPTIDEQTRNDNDGRQGEVQYLWRTPHASAVLGLGSYRIHEDQRTQSDWTPVFGSTCPVFPVDVSPCDTSTQYNRIQNTGYFYTHWNLPHALTGTVGASLDSMEERALDRTEFNPKLGLQWQLTDRLRLRAAYLEAVKRAVVVNQTLEPTHVAGFNQFFDDANQSISRRSGLGLDATPGNLMFYGVEASHRDVERPSIGQTVSFTNQDEELYRAYFNWAPAANWTLGAEYQLEKMRSVDLGPPRVDTESVPLTLRYFDERGFFGKIGVTRVRQDVTLAAGSTFDRTHESFSLVDVGVGYRLPKRRGIVSLEVRNIFDKTFAYQDLNYTSPEPVPARYLPDRTLLGRINLGF